MRTITALFAGICLVLASSPARADIIFNAATDFSPVNNPNGVWSYGQSATLTSPFVLYAQNGPVSGIPEFDSWNAGTGGVYANPSVFHNRTNQVVVNGNITLQPGQLAFHPGQSGQYSVVRFTAPSDGTFSLATLFSPADSLATTDVHVLLNNAPLFDGTVISAPTPFNANLNLHAGDKLDFKVGFGPNGNFFSDSTGLSAQLSTPAQLGAPAIPEPSTLVLLGLSTLAAFGWMRRRGRRSGL